MTHAATLTTEVCTLFAGRLAAKRMSAAIGCSVRACEDYLARRRALSLDAAVELAARNEHVEAALIARIREARARNEQSQHVNLAARRGCLAPVGGSVHGLGGLVRAPGAPGQGAGDGAATLDGGRAARAGRAADAVGRGRGR